MKGKIELMIAVNNAEGKFIGFVRSEEVKVNANTNYYERIKIVDRLKKELDLKLLVMSVDGVRPYGEVIGGIHDYICRYKKYCDDRKIRPIRLLCRKNFDFCPFKQKFDLEMATVRMRGTI